MRFEARERPRRSSRQYVVGFLVVEAKIFRQFPTHEVFFQKRLLILFRSGRPLHGEKHFFGGKVSVAEMRREPRGCPGIRIVTPLGVSGKPERNEVGKQTSGFGLPCPETRNRPERPVALGRGERLVDGFRHRSFVRRFQFRNIGEIETGGRNESFPKFRTEGSGADLVFVGNGSRRNGATGIDLENGNARGFAHGLSEGELRAYRGEIENDCRKPPVRNVFAHPLRRVVPEKRKERDADFRKPSGHVGEGIRFRGKVAEISERPRSIGNGQNDERCAAIVREFGGEKQSAVPRDPHLPIANVRNRTAAEFGRRGKSAYARGVRAERTSYRK